MTKLVWSSTMGIYANRIKQNLRTKLIYFSVNHPSMHSEENEGTKQCHSNLTCIFFNLKCEFKVVTCELAVEKLLPDWPSQQPFRKQHFIKKCLKHKIHVFQHRIRICAKNQEGILFKIYNSRSEYLTSVQNLMLLIEPIPVQQKRKKYSLPF